LAIYVGDRLGWYRALAAAGPATPTQLADRTGTSARYAREWLEHQAVAGVLTVSSAADGERRYALPAEAAEVFTDEDSLNFLAPLARMFAASSMQLPALLAAYRTGGGVSWDQLGADARESQADMNRPWFLQRLPAALATVDDLHSVLSRPGARIADVGVGAGFSSIALARAYPGATIDGYDVDEPSVRMANENAARAVLSDRLRFRVADGDSLAGSERYDAVFAFECIHDMPRPTDVLRAMREAVKEDGMVVVMDEAVADVFAPDGDELERLMYGFSLFVCLPDGMSQQPSAGTGTVMRIDTLRSYAVDAGFRDVTVLPIDDFGFWRFYELHH
jgi:predicted O-methyltransferase YrrM